MATDHSLERKFKQSVSRGVTLVDLGASWCDPCRAQTAIIRKLERRFSPAANFKIMDIEKYRDVALELGIQSIPTIILYKNGREMRRFIGLQTQDTLGQALRLLME